MLSKGIGEEKRKNYLPRGGCQAYITGLFSYLFSFLFYSSWSILPLSLLTSTVWPSLSTKSVLWGLSTQCGPFANAWPCNAWNLKLLEYIWPRHIEIWSTSTGYVLYSNFYCSRRDVEFQMKDLTDKDAFNVSQVLRPRHNGGCYLPVEGPVTDGRQAYITVTRCDVIPSGVPVKTRICRQGDWTYGKYLLLLVRDI